jgi:multiple sugar transport system permease protein
MLTPERNLDLLLSDRVLRHAIVNTSIFVVASVAAETVLGLALALLVGKLARGKGVIRTLMILPILVPPVAIGSMWKLMYNYDFGILNQIAVALGLPPLNWLGSTSVALMSVTIVDVWHWTPFVFLILFAAVESLPADVFEAARIDGATGLANLPPCHAPAATSGRWSALGRACTAISLSPACII